MVKHGFTVRGRIVVENESLFLKIAIEACPVFPGFEDRKIKALAIMGTEKVSISLFANGIRPIAFAASFKPGHL